MSRLFSVFLSASIRYPLVYGSLASVILLMLRMYFCGQIICIGAAFNIALQDSSLPEARTEKRTRKGRVKKTLEEERDT